MIRRVLERYADKPLNVMVVGAGVYVCGKGTEGYGTILPALFQAQKEGIIGGIKIAATSSSSVKILRKKIADLNKIFSFALDIESFPKNGKKDQQAYKKIIESGFRPDCAIVSVPDHFHFKIVSYLLKRNIPCLVVKPLAPTLKEVKELIKLQQKNNVYGAVEFHKRFDRSNLKLKDVLTQGSIGDPLYFLVEYSQRKSVPTKKFAQWVDHTNIFQYLGIHYVDIIYFATRAVPLRVMALGQKSYLASRGIDNYDSIQCVVEWKSKNGSKFTSSFLTNWIDSEKSSAMSDQKIKVIGTKGRYEADQKKRGISIITDEQGIEEPNPDFCGFYGSAGKEDLSFAGYGVESILQFLKDVRSIKMGKQKPADLEGRRPTFKEALVPTAVLEAANQSLEQNGAWIKINPKIWEKSNG
ncbi:MAG: Gfo/Idh/MocA family oxidoreductase [Candidatus Saganbacteria bacterium]|nr:Gfo/Idh/MocA family oxidoreductase [Candidatus Saganbacteria bacterium]